MITISVFNVSAVVIDVSSHDGLIDWNRIEEHIEGVIIRIGYGNDIEGQDDKQAIRNMNECERLEYLMVCIYTVMHLQVMK